MLTAVSALFAAAETAEEPSKTAFYICGSLLAAWAVVLAGIGMSHATFPATVGAKRGVMAISFLLMAAAMATAVITA
jgi:hypothetical protein